MQKLYAEIAARLAPLPGWTVGFGFDLFEWVEPAKVAEFQRTMEEDSSYRHLLGARGFKNLYKEVVHEVDYASWEWHRPDYDDYRMHLQMAEGRPPFSEDRFRIRERSRQRSRRTQGLP